MHRQSPFVILVGLDDHLQPVKFMRTFVAILFLTSALPVQAQDFWSQPSQLPGFAVSDLAVDSSGIHWAVSDGALQQSIDTMATWSEYGEISLPRRVEYYDGNLYVTTLSDGYFVINAEGESNYLPGISTDAIAPRSESDVVVAGGAGILWSNVSGDWEVANLPQLSLSDESADEIYRVNGVTLYQALDFQYDPYQRLLTNANGTFKLVEALETELVYADGDILYATGAEFANRPKIFRSQDGGISFEEVGAVPDDEWITAFAIRGNAVIAATLGGSVIVSQDMGASWSDASSGLTDTPDDFYISSDGYVYAIEQNDVNRSIEPLESASGVSIENQLPATVGLHVYPNPSAGETTIRVTSSSVRTVSVKVYDVLGREVQSFGGEVLPAGDHYFKIDGLASGTYYIKSGSRVRSIVIQ